MEAVCVTCCYGVQMEAAEEESGRNSIKTFLLLPDSSSAATNYITMTKCFISLIKCILLFLLFELSLIFFGFVNLSCYYLIILCSLGHSRRWLASNCIIFICKSLALMTTLAKDDMKLFRMPVLYTMTQSAGACNSWCNLEYVFTVQGSRFMMEGRRCPDILCYRK